ncbi:hypothetical protein STEG23_033893, partial [Scotinomys teguina]
MYHLTNSFFCPACLQLLVTTTLLYSSVSLDGFGLHLVRLCVQSEPPSSHKLSVTWGDHVEQTKHIHQQTELREGQEVPLTHPEVRTQVIVSDSLMKEGALL